MEGRCRKVGIYRIKRAIFGLHKYTSQILANDADDHKLNTTKKQNYSDKGRITIEGEPPWFVIPNRPTA
jgi:hypothetical protein